MNSLYTAVGTRQLGRLDLTEFNMWSRNLSMKAAFRIALFWLLAIAFQAPAHAQFSNPPAARPPGLDEASWASLKLAVTRSLGQPARLYGDGSICGEDGEDLDQFGYSVSLSGNTALIGVRWDDVGSHSNQGSAYVYVRRDDTWKLQAKLTADDGAVDDGFGVSVALSGDTAVIGASTDFVGNNFSQGSAYVFSRSGESWTQRAKLTADDGARGDEFGAAVALSGDTVLVGAPRYDEGAKADQGAAYVYVLSGSTWALQAKLLAANGAAGDVFGSSVAVSGHAVLVGAPRADVGGNVNQGQAYVYQRDQTAWIQHATLSAVSGEHGGYFGFAVALSDHTAIVGAPLDTVGWNIGQGSVYIFQRIGPNWPQQARITASDGAANDYFGSSVAVSGDIAVVGLNGLSADLSRDAAYVYSRNGANWAQRTKFSTGGGSFGPTFGTRVAISGDSILVGTPFDDPEPNGDQGSVFVYTVSGSSWTQQAKITSGAGAGNDQFGWSVALFGDTALVGAPLDDVGSTLDQGSAYVYVRDGASWILEARLVAADGAAYDQFGMSVDLVDDTALVGAYSDDVGANVDQGSAYVFVRSGTLWSQQAKLVYWNSAPGAGSGISVALSGNTAVVGAFRDGNQAQGSASVFVRSGTNWSGPTTLKAFDGAAGDEFGESVDLSGDTAIVGARSDFIGIYEGQGSAYVFTRIGANWQLQAKITAASGLAGANFGESVALFGDLALVGAPRAPAGGFNRGAAYLYARNGSNWVEQALLTASDGVNHDRFGISVALDGDIAIVGTIGDPIRSQDGQGPAYLYKRNGASWAEQAKFVLRQGSAFDSRGTSVALSGVTTLIGASWVNGTQPCGNFREGAAFVFDGADELFRDGFE